MRNSLAIYILIYAVSSFSTLAVEVISFDDAIEHMKTHEHILISSASSSALSAKADKDSAWGDPNLKIAAVNVPSSSLKFNETPMSGIRYTLGQKVPLGLKNTYTKEAILAKAKAAKLDGKQQFHHLKFELWKTLIKMKRLTSEVSIFKENLEWISQMLKVSRKLYSNGKISQSALFDLKIRKSELEASLVKVQYEIEALKSTLYYVVNKEALIKEASIPWNLLDQKEKVKLTDFSELALESKLKGSEYMLTRSKHNFIPDVSLSFSYTKRQNVDQNGDFVGAAIGITIPIGSSKRADYKESVYRNLESKRNLVHYKHHKHTRLNILSQNKKSLEKELIILKQSTKKYARSSRDITAKSYRYGKTTYFELLQTELKLQTVLLKEVNLQSKLNLLKAEKIFILGGKLNE